MLLLLMLHDAIAADATAAAATAAAATAATAVCMYVRGSVTNY